MFTEVMTSHNEAPAATGSVVSSSPTATGAVASKNAGHRVIGSPATVSVVISVLYVCYLAYISM
jgi:hypothetical protein